jgi:hypothetical protein
LKTGSYDARDKLESDAPLSCSLAGSQGTLKCHMDQLELEEQKREEEEKKIQELRIQIAA